MFQQVLNLIKYICCYFSYRRQVQRKITLFWNILRCDSPGFYRRISFLTFYSSPVSAFCTGEFYQCRSIMCLTIASTVSFLENPVARYLKKWNPEFFFITSGRPDTFTFFSIIGKGPSSVL